MLRNVQRTDTNEYIGISDRNRRVSVRTKPCKFQPANDQRAIVTTFESSAYAQAYISFEGPKILHDVKSEALCEVLQVTRY